MDVKWVTWLYHSTMWVWPSYHQWIIHTSITQTSGDIQNLTYPCNQVGLHIWHDLKSPYMTEYNNYYIIGIFMTFTSSDIHEIYNKDQRSKQDHDSHQQLSYTIYDLHHKHLSATSITITCICPSSKESSELKQLCVSRNISIIMYQGLLKQNIMPKMHY